VPVLRLHQVKAHANGSVNLRANYLDFRSFLNVTRVQLWRTGRFPHCQAQSLGNAAFHLDNLGLFRFNRLPDRIQDKEKVARRCDFT